MTLRDFRRRKSDAYGDYQYYAWACCQPSTNEESYQQDIKKKEKAYALYQKYVKFEDKVLEEALKNIKEIS